VLGPAYEAFTQGLETTDLRQARALLEELAE
jgi:predicted ATPase